MTEYDKRWLHQVLSLSYSIIFKPPGEVTSCLLVALLTLHEPVSNSSSYVTSSTDCQGLSSSSSRGCNAPTDGESQGTGHCRSVAEP